MRKLPSSKSSTWIAATILLTATAAFADVGDFFEGIFNQIGQPPSNSQPADPYNAGAASGYLGPSILVQSTSPEIIQLAQQLTAGKTTDAQKVKAVHDWVMDNIRYNVGQFQAIEQGRGQGIAFDALTVLHTRSSICNGYSTLTAALLRAVGVRTKIVLGVGGPGAARGTGSCNANHAWNEVVVNGHWMSVDTTFDAGNVVNGTTWEFVGKSYYMLHPTEFLSEHRKCQDMGY